MQITLLKSLFIVLIPLASGLSDNQKTLDDKKINTNIEGGEAEFTGSIDRHAIRLAIRENSKDFQTCYESALTKNPEAMGRIELQWDIDGQGRPSNINVVTSEIHDPNFKSCMEDEISKLNFPRPPEGQIARVIFPFSFNNL